MLNITISTWSCIDQFLVYYSVYLFNYLMCFNTLTLEPQMSLMEENFFYKKLPFLLVTLTDFVSKKEIVGLIFLLTSWCKHTASYLLYVVQDNHGLRPAYLLKKRLWHKYFPMNFAKFLRTPLFTDHLRWLLFELF